MTESARNPHADETVTMGSSRLFKPDMKDCLRPLLLVAALWVILRVLFFEGLWGVDDLAYVNFALSPGIPTDVFQARVLFNSSLILSFSLFGFGEWVASLPALIGSLLFLVATYLSGRALLGSRYGLLAAVLAAFLSLDVVFSTVPLPGSVANAFCAAGTALVLTHKGKYYDLLSAVLLGLSILTHLAFLFFLGPFLAAVVISEPTRKNLLRVIRLGTFSIAVFLILDLSFYAIVAGDPLLHLEIIRSSHWAFPDVLLPLFLQAGEFNPEWFSWTLRHFLAGKGFGLMLSISVLGSLGLWSRLGGTRRLLFLVVLLGWLYLAFGTQQVFEYRPLEREERFWYPLALPLCLLAASLVQLVRDPLRQRLLAGALIVPMPLILLSSGPFGQNVEITKELLAHANSQTAVTFATDPQTLDEMFILGGRTLPPNVASFCGPWPLTFHWEKAPRNQCIPRAPGPYEILVNLPNLDRLKVADLRTLVDEDLDLNPISAVRWRWTARLLPTHLRDSLPATVRKQPAYIGRLALSDSDPETR